MRLDPTSLELFVSVVEEGSIAAAAGREHIAAAAVSSRVNALEEALQTVLLKRTNRGIVPTAAGLALVSLARGVLHSMDEVFLQMREYATGVRGHVRVFANISSITEFLPREIQSFLAEYPKVQIHLEERASSVVARAVAENAADLGFVTLGPYGEDLETRVYHTDQLVVITPKRHPLAHRRAVVFAETLDYEYVGLHAGTAINLQLARSACELHRTLKLRIQVSSYDALCQMVGAGLGIGLLPRSVADPYARVLGIRVISLKEAWADRQLGMCARSFEALPMAAKLFVSHVEKLAR